MKRQIVWLLASLSVMVWAQDVESTLKKFDKNPVAAAANDFFEALAAEEFIGEKIAFPVSAPTDSLRQQVWYWAAEWLYDQGRYKEAERYALDALKKYHPSNPERADCLNTLGCIYVRLSDFKQAAHYVRQCVEADLKGGDHDKISSSLNTLAGILMAGYQAKEAEPVILQAIEHAKKADNPGRKAVILGMASEIYHMLGDDDKALSFADEAIKTEQGLDRKPKLAIRLSQKGSALLGLHRYKEAEELYRRVVPEFKEMGDIHSYAIALNRLGMALLCQKRPSEAIPYYKEAAALFSEMGDLYNEIHAYRGLYESYWTVDPDSAKAALDRFDLLKDSLYTHTTAEALSRYSAEFGNDQLLQENAEVHEANKRIVAFAVIAILAIVLIAWIIVRQVRLRERKRIAAMMKEIEQLRAKGEPEGEAKVANSTVVGQAEECVEEPTAGEKGERLFLMRVIETVNEGLADGQWSVDVVASKMNMSVQTFRRRMMAAAGESPKAFISAIQMVKAGKLLTDNRDMPVADVALKCGFSEASSFTHTFKRVYGMTPSQYRERPS